MHEPRHPLDLDSPEVPFSQLVRCDFSGCERPLLFACRSESQLLEFLVRVGVPRGDVHRIVGDWSLPHHAKRRPGRVLFLLPGWLESKYVAEAVQEWILEDRHTCRMEPLALAKPDAEPRAPDRMPRVYAAFCGACALALGIEIVAASPWRVAVPWLLAAIAFALAAVERWEPRTWIDDE